MRNTFDYYDHDTYLEHHGIKGQKWGIRRYQNPDGTLTEEGKKRYLSVDSNFVFRDPKNKFKTYTDRKIYSQYTKKLLDDASDELDGILSTKPKNEKERQEKIEKQNAFINPPLTYRERNKLDAQIDAIYKRMDEYTRSLDDSGRDSVDPKVNKKQKTLRQYIDSYNLYYSWSNGDDAYRHRNDPFYDDIYNKYKKNLSKAAKPFALQMMQDLNFEYDPKTFDWFFSTLVLIP